MQLDNWLTLACEHCTTSFSIDDSLKNRGRCPECHTRIRPVIAILLEAATEWTEMSQKFINDEQLLKVVH